VSVADPPESQLKGLRVLIVDDAAEILDAVGGLLRAEGVEVVAAARGSAALDALREIAFDVVLMDLGLPDIPGEVLIREVLAVTSPRPRVVAITGFPETRQESAKAAGADVVLVKPFDWRELRTHLTGSDRTPGTAAA
jgi:DNA-binding response OmpR family regulator